jgi:TetR/AcrR family transcriptional regulator, cholesterol catabolism regulator
MPMDLKSAEKLIQPKTFKRNIENRRNESRRKILDVAMELFYEQGYEKTTTRQIIQKAGILNGSLYNKFSNKEEILTTLLSEALRDALKESEDVLRGESDIVMAFALPAALELRAASISHRAAELLYEGHKSWKTVEAFSDIAFEWAGTYLTRMNQGID